MELGQFSGVLLLSKKRKGRSELGSIRLYTVILLLFMLPYGRTGQWYYYATGLKLSNLLILIDFSLQIAKWKIFWVLILL